MGLVAAFVRNPIKVAVGVILVVLFGILALIRMPMQLTPEVQTPTITIETRWPGASPQEVEREIVQEQEEQLKAVEGVTKMSSESMDSMGRVVLEFVVGTDMSAALLKVNTRLSQVREYPEEADEPVINTANSSDNPIAWFILSEKVPSDAEIDAFVAKYPDMSKPMQPVLLAGTGALRYKRLTVLLEKHPNVQELLPPPRDISTLQLFAEDTIEARFERVPGVANSNVLGGRERELQVVLDPQRLAARGLTIDDIRNSLRGRNVDLSAGDFWEGKRRYVVRTLGRFDSPEDVAGLEIATIDAGRVYLRDVASVHMGYKKPGGLVRSFGANVIAVNCLRDTEANVMDVMAGLRAALQELNEGPLGDRRLTLTQVYDETDYIESAVGLVQQNILVGGLLTILVLLIFLRSARSTLVIAIAIPTSIIGTFLLLQAMGRSLNVISLAGLAFAVGMLVDNAVVVLENIYRRYQGGERRFDAATKGTQEVWGAVTASTLTTLAVFLPILFVEEEAGQLFRDIALAISCSVSLSLIVSVTVIPVATSRILSRNAEGGAKRSMASRVLDPVLAPLDFLARQFVRGVIGIHVWMQRGVLRQLGVVVVLVGLAVYGAVMLFPKTEYLPSGNRNLAIGILLPPPGYNIDQLVSMGQQVEDRLRPYWDVDRRDPEALAKLDYPAIGHFFFVVRGRSVFLGVRAIDPLRAGELVPLIKFATSGIPATFGVAKQTSLFERGISGGRTIDVEITGPDLERLVGLGRQVFGMAMGALPGAQIRPKPSLDLSNPEVHVLPRWDRAAELGISARELGYAVNSLVDGAYAGDYYDQGDKIDLTLMGRPDLSGRLQDLEGLPLATPGGQLVPLRALAEVRLASGPEQIDRRERERAITIEISPPQDVALEDALDTIKTQIIGPMKAQGAISGEYRVNLAGTADKLEATWKALGFNVLLAVLITYLLMAALFESWLYPFVIMLSVPLGAVGGLGGLWLLNQWVSQPLDVLTMLGFVILIGTVVNNAILIVHQSLVHIREEDMSPADAVLASVRTRIRPIFMTTTTTVCGLLPLVLFPGAGSELYRGLGSVLLGGLIVSTVFTLFVVPALFRITLSLRTVLARMVFGSQPAE
jgi:HAE1 family hydrophobic/amphiphilic exporter-1